MAETKSDLLAKIAEAQAAVDAERKQHAEEVETLKASLQAAWEADNKEEHDAAMARLDDLINSLNAPSPVFSPSAN
jgi:hypothetical protein